MHCHDVPSQTSFCGETSIAECAKKISNVFMNCTKGHLTLKSTLTEWNEKGSK